jgi:hypothetical protein
MLCTHTGVTSFFCYSKEEFMIDYMLNAYSGTGHFTGCKVKFFVQTLWDLPISKQQFLRYMEALLGRLNGPFSGLLVKAK